MCYQVNGDVTTVGVGHTVGILRLGVILLPQEIIMMTIMLHVTIRVVAARPGAAVDLVDNFIAFPSHK